MYRNSSMAKPTFKSAFEGKLSLLQEKLEVSLKLLSELLDVKLLTKEHVQKIKAKITDEEKVLELLEILKKRDDSQFDYFCRALENCEQDHVVDIFCPKEYDWRKGQWRTDEELPVVEENKVNQETQHSSPLVYTKNSEKDNAEDSKDNDSIGVL